MSRGQFLSRRLSGHRGIFLLARGLFVLSAPVRAVEPESISLPVGLASVFGTFTADLAELRGRGVDLRLME